MSYTVFHLLIYKTIFNFSRPRHKKSILYNLSLSLSLSLYIYIYIYTYT